MDSKSSLPSLTTSQQFSVLFLLIEPIFIERWRKMKKDTYLGLGQTSSQTILDVKTKSPAVWLPKRMAAEVPKWIGLLEKRFVLWKISLFSGTELFHSARTPNLSLEAPPLEAYLPRDQEATCPEKTRPNKEIRISYGYSQFRDYQIDSALF